MRRVAFRAAFFSILVFSAIARAQAADTGLSSGQPDADPGATAAGNLAPKDGDLTAATLEMDINTAGFYDLVDWCRKEGLKDSGSVQELRERLYLKYGITKRPDSAKTGTEDAGSGDKSGPPPGSNIKILSAQSTERFSLSPSGEEYVRLSGGVRITAENGDGKGVHDIQADDLLLNETRNLLQAGGNVVYERKTPGGSEFFYGDDLVVDLDTWDAEFVHGRNERMQDASLKMIFSAETISRREDNVLVFKNAVITSCDEAEPHYSIHAPDMWLLGGNEIAISNAVMFVGHVPVFWFPFFYYPGDELFFNPVLGGRMREGPFLQTTTYLLGRKTKKDGSFSLLKLGKDADNDKKVLKGLFLRSTGRADGAKSADYLKVMADYYVNLGFFSGVQAKLKPPEPFTSFSLFSGIGFSRNVYRLSDTLYSPFKAERDYVSQWNDSLFAGMVVPFRWGLNVQGEASLADIALGINLPFYSDPFFNADFLNRQEDVDWFSLLNPKTQADLSPVQAPLSSLAMKLSSSWKPLSKLPFPWLSALSVTRLNSSFNWVTRDSTTVTGTGAVAARYESVDPRRKFFAPDQNILFDTAVSMGGSFLQFPFKPAAAARKPEEKGKAETGKPFEPDKTYRDPFGGKTDDAEDGKAEGTAAAADPFHSVNPLPDYPLRQADPLSLSLNWTLDPQGSLEKRYNSAAWKSSDEVDLEELYSLYGWKVSGGVTFAMSLYGNLLSTSLSLKGQTGVQEHFGLIGDTSYLSQAMRDLFEKTDAEGSSTTISSALTTSLKPFVNDDLLSPNALKYDLAFPLYRRRFASMQNGDAAFETKTFEWNKDSVTSHSIGMTLGFMPFGWTETIVIESVLPPLQEAYSGTANIQLFSFSGSVAGRLWRDPAIDALKFDPVTVSAVWKPWSFLAISDTCKWDSAKEVLLSNSLALSLGDFRMSLLSSFTKGATLVPGTGWVSDDKEIFRHTYLSMNYPFGFKPDPLWKNRLSVSLDGKANLSINMLKFTETSFTFETGFSVRLANVLNLKFTAFSSNPSAYRYFIGLPGFETGSLDIPWVNPLEDIAKGFDFADPEGKNRKASLFKLNSISVSSDFDLHDWILTFAFTGKPELDSTASKPRYEFRSSYSVFLKWKAIPEIKTNLAVTNDSFSVE